jgi:hypothetical protein
VRAHSARSRLPSSPLGAGPLSVSSEDLEVADSEADDQGRPQLALPIYVIRRICTPRISARTGPRPLVPGVVRAMARLTASRSLVAGLWRRLGPSRCVGRCGRISGVPGVRPGSRIGAPAVASGVVAAALAFPMEQNSVELEESDTLATRDGVRGKRLHIPLRLRERRGADRTGSRRPQAIWPGLTVRPKTTRSSAAQQLSCAAGLIQRWRGIAGQRGA